MCNPWILCYWYILFPLPEESDERKGQEEGSAVDDGLLRHALFDLCKSLLTLGPRIAASNVLSGVSFVVLKNTPQALRLRSTLKSVDNNNVGTSTILCLCSWHF